LKVKPLNSLKAITLGLLMSAPYFAAAAVRADDTITQQVITLDAAEKVITAAKQFATNSGWPGVIAVTDSSGAVVAMARMDGAAIPAGVVIAPGKARTAALFRKPSGDLEAAINGPRPAITTAGDFVMMRGGIPLWRGKELIGAIGVSADVPDHDQAIAEAGAAALN
jgi:glc operon protein GlcG